jgi:hypothetical protein
VAKKAKRPRIIIILITVSAIFRKQRNINKRLSSVDAQSRSLLQIKHIFTCSLHYSFSLGCVFNYSTGKMMKALLITVTLSYFGLASAVGGTKRAVAFTPVSIFGILRSA